MNTIKSGIIFLIANGVGLFLATLLLPNFKIDFWSFLIVTVVFSVILAVITPLIRKFSEKKAPALLGGLSLIAILACLFVTSLLMSGMSMGGPINWIATTLLVWIGSMIATLILPRFIPIQKKST